MKKEEFKEMTYNHCVLCERIIEAKGKCRVIECIECPFHYKNMTNGDDCFQNEYAEDISMESEDEILVESCKKFIQLYKEDVACLAPSSEAEIKTEVSTVKKEDFKEMKAYHWITCKKIIDRKGDCSGLDCSKCPFDFRNMVNGNDCVENSYASNGACDSECGKLVENCEKFIQLYDGVAPCSPAPEEKTENLEEVEDIVNNPKHYRIPGTDVQVIQVIKGVLTKEEFEGSLKSNVIKYILREKEKGGLKDLEKAYKYLGWLIASKKNLELF